MTRSMEECWHIKRYYILCRTDSLGDYLDIDHLKIWQTGTEKLSTIWMYFKVVSIYGRSPSGIRETDMEERLLEIHMILNTFQVGARHM
jgi:hypothetical protein